jgi:pimeloyl-ACP methyl ester carboxylesterase
VSDAAIGRTQIEIDGAGSAIVFVHGLGGTSNSFQTLLPALGGFRCIRPDLPGSGRSPRPFQPLSIALFVDTIAEIVEKLGGGAVHLAGHSMGTLVCQHVAARHPDSVKSLTLFGPIVDPSEAARQRLKDRARAARQDGMTAIADAAASGGTSSASRNSNPLLVPLVRESHMRQDADGFAQTCEALAAAEAADLRFLRCPTLIVTGDEDAVAPPSAAQALADKVKGSKLKILDHCGHWTPFERSQDCARLLSEHVRAHDGA